MSFLHHLWLNIPLRVVVIYLFVLIGIRLTGKREVGQMAPFDLVLLLLIANAVQNAMTGPDTSVVGGILAAGTLLVINWLVTGLVWRSQKIRGFVEGSPALLVHHGKCILETMSRERITQEDLMQVFREHGVSNLNEVAQAVLEVDGSISILKKDEVPSITKPHHRIRFLKKR